MFASISVAADKETVSPNAWYRDAEKTLSTLQAEVSGWAPADSGDAANMNTVDRRIGDSAYCHFGQFFTGLPRLKNNIG